MRLTMLLVGVAALVAGIYSGTREIRVSAANQYRVGTPRCGSAFNPIDYDLLFSATREACSEAIGVWPAISLMLLAVAAVVLIRLLYMFIGPRAAGQGS
jgi:hypothetical protein